MDQRAPGSRVHCLHPSAPLSWAVLPVLQGTPDCGHQLEGRGQWTGAGQSWDRPGARGGRAQVCRLLCWLSRNVPECPPHRPPLPGRWHVLTEAGFSVQRARARAVAGKGPGWRLQAVAEETGEPGAGQEPWLQPWVPDLLELRFPTCNIVFGSSSERTPFSQRNLNSSLTRWG